MKLKKWGSLLTALAMIGSMATYVPASVSADETDVVTHSGTFQYATDVAYSITEYPDTLLDNNETKDAENVLEIYAVTDGATYTVPNGLFEDVAYEMFGATTVFNDENGDNDYDTEAELQENIDRVVIKGNAVLDNAELATDSAPKSFEAINGVSDNTITVEIDCRTSVETVSESSTVKNLVTAENIGFVTVEGSSYVTAEIVHDYEPNTTYNNHVCVYCNDIDTAFTAHDFTKTGGTVNTSKGTHTCDCGKTDADYLVKNEDGSYMTVDDCIAIINDENATEAQKAKAEANKASIEYYKLIHGFEGDTHKCGVCGAYDVVQHQGTNLDYVRLSTTHKLQCAKCGYSTTATKHTYATYWELDTNTEDDIVPTKTVAGRKIEVGMHYCTVCGYVPGVTYDDNTGLKTEGEYNGGHTYDSKFVYQWDKDKQKYVKTIVTATTAAEKTVCKCGAVEDGHEHSYKNLNEHHMCFCGNEQNNHSYDYNYTVTGTATVNGEKGWTLIAGGKGAVCSCGLVDEDHETYDGTTDSPIHVDTYAEFKNAVDRSLKNKNTANEEGGYKANTSFYTDTTTGKHYCTCGKEAVYTAAYDSADNDSVDAAAGDAIHYYVNVKDEKHTCTCGKVNDTLHVYSDTTNPATVEGAGVGYYVVAKNSSNVYQLVYLNEDADAANYTAVTCETAGELADGDELAYAEENGVYCKCGKLNPTHVCDFTNKAMCINGVHYCVCGKASEAHDYGTDNKCKVCGEYVEHDHKPTSNTDCTCAVCGEPAHALIQSGTYGHKCQICAQPVDEHVYVADTTAHTHTCEICGYVAKESDNAHRYGTTGTAQCICTECGLDNHTRADGDNANTEDVTEKHYCTVCATDLSDVHVFNHIYDAESGTIVVNEVDGYKKVTDEDSDEYKDCVICACGEIKTGHVCEFYGNAPETGGTVGKVDRAGVTVKAQDEYCACGKVLSHKLGLATNDNVKDDNSTADASFHACVNKTETGYVDGNGNGVCDEDEKKDCEKFAEPHNFPSSVVSGKTVYATFCTGCGAVNPEKLNRARFVADILNAPTTPESEHDYDELCTEQHNTYIATYTTSYIVSLTKDTQAVLAYDVVSGGVEAELAEDGKTWTYTPSMAGADTTSAVYYQTPADVAKIKIAATTAEQTAFNTLLKTFNTTDAAASKNLAGGSVKIEYITSAAVATAVGETGAATDKLDATTIYGKVGSDVEVKMLVNEGYKFSGWYSDAKATTLISKDQITSVEVDNGETVIYALIEKNETKLIGIPANVTYWSTVTQPGTKDLTVNQSVKFCVGETVYMKGDADFLSFNNKNGNAFVYNCNSSNLADTDPASFDCYAFTVRYADTYTMEVKPGDTATNGNVYVIFKNSNNDRILSQGLTDNGSAAGFEPDAPAQAGKTFVGWKKLGDATNAVVRTKTIGSTEAANSTVVLVPLFKNRTDLKLTLENGSFLDAAQEAQNATGFEYGTPIKITAPEKNTKTGKYFSGWYDGDELVYGTRTVAHIITDTVTLTAKYEGSSELKAETSYVLSSKRNETSTGEQVVLTASWNIVEDVTVLDTGYVFTLAGASADKLTIENVDGSNVQLKQTGLKSKYAVYNYNMNLKDSTGASAKTVTAKFYVNYIDANGIEQTIYTDAVTEAPLS